MSDPAPLPVGQETSDGPVEWEAMLAAAASPAASLEAALTSNRRIGVAIGILMTRNGLTEYDAFEMLRQASQRSNRKLRDLAEVVIYTGSLTGEDR